MNAVVRGAAVAAVLAASLSARSAAACGGTFCDSGPTAMPVDQTGENIFFVVDAGTVEAHVQIQYQGDPERFAWIVPMPAIPTVSVGSEQLFSNLLGATVPSYGYFTQRDSCPCTTCSTGSGGSTSAGGSGSYGPGGADAGVQVYYQRTVGAFEVAALTGNSSTEVVDWLTANGYQNSPTAPSILDEYVQKGSVFVAVKLTAGKGLDQIHPLVFKYAGTEPCIPIELTAVAAVPDMGVRAFFLGDDRVVSTNYAQITLNPARIDWSTMGQNYGTVVSRAVDEAGGHAFVTEYAGPSSIVYAAGLVSPLWDATAFAALPATSVADELRKQGLLYCYADECTPNHPLILPLLNEFLPVPAGVGEGAYYSCVSCYAGDGAPPAFDSQAFGNALADRIFEPARHIAALFQRFPHLTRLFTTISPSEMTLDPFFEARAGLPDVMPPGTATFRVTMTSQSGFTLPDGRMVALDGSSWPSFTSAMPWTEKIDAYPAGLPANAVADSSALIATELDAWNQSHDWPLPPPQCSPFGGIGGYGAGGAAYYGDFVTGGAGGSWSEAPFRNAQSPADDSSCVVNRGRRSRDDLVWLAALLGALLIRLRRR